jgi:RNA-splicing ligase RtcB
VSLEHISPSGVGYDIGCIAAGTRVTTEDGTTIPIECAKPTERVVSLARVSGFRSPR